MFAVSRVFAGAFKASTRAALDVRRFKSTGRVQFFDSVKGFGFITPEDGSDDVFVHQSNIHAKGFRDLAEGEEVEYDLDVDPRRGKLSALNVTGPEGAFVKGTSFESRRPVGDRRFDDSR
jgi:cold shock CspA family protein